MATSDFFWLVRTPGTYPESGKQRSRFFDSEARSHAALAYHRRRHQVDRKRPLTSKKVLSPRALVPRRDPSDDPEVDSPAGEFDRRSQTNGAGACDEHVSVNHGHDYAAAMTIDAPIDSKIGAGRLIARFLTRSD